MVPKRHNNKWNSDEINNLHREYDLLEMTIDEISNAHERTIFSILHKLQKEGIIENWVSARGWKKKYQTDFGYQSNNDDSEDDSDDEDYEEDDSEEDDSEEDDFEEDDEDSEEDDEDDSEEDDNQVKKKQQVNVLSNEKDNDMYNIEVNGVQTAVINFLYFLAFIFEYITSYVRETKN